MTLQLTQFLKYSRFDKIMSLTCHEVLNLSNSDICIHDKIIKFVDWYHENSNQLKSIFGIHCHCDNLLLDMSWMHL